MKRRPGRIPELDGVRGVAILMVIVWHYFYSEIHPAKHSLLARIALPFSLCWSGVDLFFVLSGFLIAGILLENRETENYFRVFYFRRVCRLGPVYALLLLSFGLVYPWASGQERFGWLVKSPLPIGSYLTFTQNIFMGIRDTFGPTWLAPTWSLAVEEQFYSLLPILIWVLPPKALRVVLVLAIGAAPLLRAQVSPIAGQVEMPMRSDSLLVGALLAFAVRNEAFLLFLRSHRRAFGGVFLGLLAGAVVMCVRAGWFGVFVQTWLAALYSMLLLTPFAAADSGLSRVLRAPILRFFGTVSYSLYLVHQIVVGLLHGLVYGREPRIDDLAGAALTVLSFGLSVAIAYGIFRTIEKRAVARGHRYAYVPRAEPPGAAARVPEV